MSVLARLALRALGAPSPVRPRLGGLFERDAAASDLAYAPGPPTGSTTLSIPVLDLPPAAEHGPETDSLASAHFAPTRAEARFELSPSALREPASASPPQTWDSAGRVSEMPPPAELGADRTIIREVVDRFAPVAGPGAAPHRPLAEAHPPEPGAASLAPPSVPAPSAAPYQPLLPPQRSDRPLPAALPAASAQAPGEPDVHISIGRIEVRGEPETRRPAPAQRGGAKLMSLEDYLGRGRRR